jgi:hypothetical protein
MNLKEVLRILNRCLVWTYNVLVCNSIRIAGDTIVNKTVTMNCDLGSVAEAQNFPCNMGSLKWKPLSITGILNKHCFFYCWIMVPPLPLFRCYSCQLVDYVHLFIHAFFHSFIHSYMELRPYWEAAYCSATQEPAGFPPRRPGFKPGSGHLQESNMATFWVKMVRVFSERALKKPTKISVRVVR